MKKRYVVHREKHDEQDRRRHDAQDDELYLAYPAACDPSNPCFFKKFL